MRTLLLLGSRELLQALRRPVRALGQSSACETKCRIERAARGDSCGSHEDIHTVVDNIQQRAQNDPSGKAASQSKITMRFTMVLSEICQNMIEHAGTRRLGGRSDIQVAQRLGGRNVVVIAVCDAGMGFRRSLESSPESSA